MLLRRAFLRGERSCVPLGCVEISGNPAPASRPRVTRWGVYYGKHYTAWKESAEKEVMPGPFGEHAVVLPTDPLFVIVQSVVAKPKSGKKLWPTGDVDNYAKGPLDVLTKAKDYWRDDDQVVVLLTSKRYATAGEDPHTRIEAYLWTDML